jgi:hypothetical protein
MGKGRREGEGKEDNEGWCPLNYNSDDATAAGYEELQFQRIHLEKLHSRLWMPMFLDAPQIGLHR